MGLVSRKKRALQGHATKRSISLIKGLTRRVRKISPVAGEFSLSRA
jgi:hypothetical protein